MRQHLIASSCAALAGLALAGAVQAQSAIGPGQTIEGRLSADDPVLDDGSHYDCYRLAAAPGQTVDILMRSGAFDAYLTVSPSGCDGYGSDAVSDDDGGGGTDSRVSLTLDGGGPYHIRANSLLAGDTGPYSLSVLAGDRGGAGRMDCVTGDGGSGDVVGDLMGCVPVVVREGVGRDGVRIVELDSTRFRIAAGGEREWRTDLSGMEEFIVVGVCDGACSDLDMEVFDASGASVGDDFELDDTPMVVVSGPGRYRVRMSLPDCAAATCETGVVALGLGD